MRGWGLLAVAALAALATPAGAAAKAPTIAIGGGALTAKTRSLAVVVRTPRPLRLRVTAGAQGKPFARTTRLDLPRGRSVRRLTLTATAKRLVRSSCAVLTVHARATRLARPQRPIPTFTARALSARRAFPPARQCAPKPSAPLFQVGAGTQRIAPDEPVFSGGFGLSPPIQRETDPLSTRALYVSNGKSAVVFAVVDAQGWFAATQLESDDGMQEIREEAAKQIGPPLRPQDIIVQSTHSHAAPTLEGIWGPVPPAYLAKVRDRTIAAIVDAAKAARPASLQWGEVDAPYIDNIATAQTDSYPGWIQDGQLTALRAVAPGGATVATFVNVPAHGDIVCGSCDELLSADYFGPVRDALEAQLGGTAIVGPATLGREESPVQATSVDNMRWYAGTIGELAVRALSQAHWITDTTVSSTETTSKIAGTNAALLALVTAWSLPDDVKQQEAEQSGIYPIDRSIAPEWQAGPVISTPLTALRIGGLVFLSMPGEPFPEVRLSIANAAPPGAGGGPDAIVALSKAQDDLGYFYPAFDYGFTFAYPSDHGTYNVAPQLGDQVIQEQLANIGRLGYATDPTVPLPPEASYEQALKPGLQALASPARGDAGEDGRFAATFQAIYSPADLAGNPIAGKVHWDFGDGTTADTDALQFGGDKNPPTRFEHRFAPGSYTVKLSAVDTQGNAAAWEVPVVAYPRLRAVARLAAAAGRVWTVRGSARGGDGRVLSLAWRFGDGATASGAEVTHRFARGAPRTATLTVTDGTGGTATADVLRR